ncbi:MAG: FAD-binding oxidoreductase, partial [Proteobacteria bacterium]|nr:FAD-binding oxidoreductase [Pseudomonadota bacterium]
MIGVPAIAAWRGPVCRRSPTCRADPPSPFPAADIVRCKGGRCCVIVIVGGGVMGSSIAWHLAGEPAFDGKIVVVERDPTYARASSALSASSIRQQFSTPLNIHLSRYGIGFLRRAKELLDVDLGLKEPGYLFLASAAGEAVLRANHAIQKGEGCAVELLEPAGLAQRFPALSTNGIALASH